MLKRCQILLEDWQVSYLKRRPEGVSMCGYLRAHINNSIVDNLQFSSRFSKDKIKTILDSLSFQARKKAERRRG